MTANAQTITELLRQRHLIDHIQDEQTRLLAARWASTWDAIESELRTATLALAQLDDDQKATAAIRTIKARDALAIASYGLTDCLAASNHAAAATARHLIEQAASDQDALITTQLPPGHTVNLASVDARQIDAIARRTLQQITVRHWYLNAAATDAMKHALTVGLTLGRSPRQVATHMVRAVQGNFEGGLARALVIARTEQLDAYRAAAQAHHAANRDILQGWQWYAELDHRTCASCISHHGELHPLDDPGPLDHHQGRCTRLPVTKAWNQLGFDDINEPDSAVNHDDGYAWFRRQPEDTQRDILGPKRFQAWTEGRYPPDDWTTLKRHWSPDEHGVMRQDWRDSWHVGPVRKPGQKGLPPIEPTTVQPPAPSGPLDRLPRLAAPETGVESLTRTNPNYRKSPDYQNNCPNCALSWELRQRGYNVEAEPLANGRPTRESLKNWGLDPMSEEAHYLPGTGKAHINKLAKTLPDGARGMIRCNWKRTYGGGGHIWVWEKQDGKIVLRDPQSGDTNVARYLNQAQTGSIRMWRTDDKDFTADSLKGWVKARKEK